MADDGSPRSGWRTALGLLAAAALGLAFAWTAFGPGARHCSVSVSVPFLTRGQHAGDALCRGAFGVATALALAVVLLFTAALVRLRAPGRFADALEKAGQWIAILLLTPLLLIAALLASPVWIARWIARRARRA
ncbi:MAG TPA: hypothetical protein VLY46_05150 [Usitatibacter sp.]|nr:hypothetical protein [Usitatibacter sp.]